jgi:hypothetical protein|mmetsp:Transcript_13624/g.42109  ORF Transcript_13624/g.42109 Transcript_13624/m.42109 type:complete len:88 (+) Transcript_13624:1408-1671(+)
MSSCGVSYCKRFEVPTKVKDKATLRIADVDQEQVVVGCGKPWATDAKFKTLNWLAMLLVNGEDINLDRRSPMHNVCTSVAADKTNVM